MSKYLMMIFDNEAAWAAADASVAEANHQRHGEFARTNQAAIRGGARLGASSTATSVRSDGNGEFAVTDGTFAETKEVLGGYYIIEAADLDEALTIAKQVPAPMGGIEVRPIID